MVCLGTTSGMCLIFLLNVGSMSEWSLLLRNMIVICWSMSGGELCVYVMMVLVDQSCMLNTRDDALGILGGPSYLMDVIN